MKLRSHFWALLIIAILSGCTFLDGSNGNELDGTSWKLLSYGERIPLEGRAITADFTASEISGSSGCNHYFGRYQVKGNRISIKSLAWTEMACLDPEGIMEQEQTEACIEI